MLCLPSSCPFCNVCKANGFDIVLEVRSSPGLRGPSSFRFNAFSHLSLPAPLAYVYAYTNWNGYNDMDRTSALLCSKTINRERLRIYK